MPPHCLSIIIIIIIYSRETQSKREQNILFWWKLFWWERSFHSVPSSKPACLLFVSQFFPPQYSRFAQQVALPFSFSAAAHFPTLCANMKRLFSQSLAFILKCWSQAGRAPISKDSEGHKTSNWTLSSEPLVTNTIRGPS